MRLLLDTHVLLWVLGGSRELGARAVDAIERATVVRVSVVSFAEIGVKVAVGKLTVPDDLRDRVLATGVRLLELSAEHGLAAGRLPLHHRDPFDRLLIAQAHTEGLTVVTADSRFSDYDISVVPAD